MMTAEMSDKVIADNLRAQIAELEDAVKAQRVQLEIAVMANLEDREIATTAKLLIAHIQKHRQTVKSWNIVLQRDATDARR